MNKTDNVDFSSWEGYEEAYKAITIMEEPKRRVLFNAVVNSLMNQ